MCPKKATLTSNGLWITDRYTRMWSRYRNIKKKKNSFCFFRDVSEMGLYHTNVFVCEKCKEKMIFSSNMDKCIVSILYVKKLFFLFFFASMKNYDKLLYIFLYFYRGRYCFVNYLCYTKLSIKLIVALWLIILFMLLNYSIQILSIIPNFLLKFIELR